MKIAVDARELAGRPTGVGRYLFELLVEWSRMTEAIQHEWVLYAHAPLAVPPAFASKVHVISGAGGTRWEQWALAQALRRKKPNVLFAPAYTSPLTSPCPVVLTIHDVSFSAHPEWFRVREGTRRRTFTRLSAMRAATIVTDSAFSRSEIVRHLGVAASRIRVIPLAIRPRITRASPRTPREPIVLFVGSIFRRRHVDTLIRAFARHVVPQVPDSRLEIVGENRTYPRVNLERELTLQTLEAQRRIAIRSYIPDEELGSLYSRASVFAFASEYEGFGLTPLEALGAGIPPVVLDTPVASEVYGPAARYVANVSPFEKPLGDAIVQLLTSDAARGDVLRHAPAVLARYDWEKTAIDTLRAIREAAHA